MTTKTPPLKLDDLLVGYTTRIARVPSSWKWQHPCNHHGVFLGTTHHPTMLALRSKDIVHIFSYWERVAEGSTPRSRHWQVQESARAERDGLTTQLDRFKARKKVFRLTRRGSAWVLPFIPALPFCSPLEYGTIRKISGQWVVSALAHPKVTCLTLRDARANLRSKFDEFVGGQVA